MSHYLKTKTPFHKKLKTKCFFFFLVFLSLPSTLPLSLAQQLFPYMTNCISFSRTLEVKASTIWLTILYFIKHWWTLQWVLIFKELRNIASPLIPSNKSQFNTIFALLVMTNELILKMNSKTNRNILIYFPLFGKPNIKSNNSQKTSIWFKLLVKMVFWSLNSVSPK